MPKILISTVPGGGDNYIRAVEKYGAEGDAGYLPGCRDGYSALILGGGGDVTPPLCDLPSFVLKDTDERRDECEFALVREFVSKGLPILGICRGMQILSLIFGGKLRAEARFLQMHFPSISRDVFHPVYNIGGLFRETFGGEMRVNSYHRQAVEDPGEGFDITQLAPDGTPEGMVHRSLPIFAFQWHPERITDSARGSSGEDPLLAEEAERIIFSRFVALASDAEKLMRTKNC